MNPNKPVEPLLGCPFCGDTKPTYKFDGEVHSFECWNENCAIVVEAQCYSEAGARAIWNKRAESKPQSVSHVIPEEVEFVLNELRQTTGLVPGFTQIRAYSVIKAAYAKIAELEKERLLDHNVIYEVLAQLSTLNAQTKEVVRAGDEMAYKYGWITSAAVAWKAATAALRQSGQGSTE